MALRNPLVALLLSLCLLIGAVGEAVARNEMAGMSDLVLCGAGGATTVTLDATGQPVQRHPCTHCLAASHLALTVGPVMLATPALIRAEALVQQAVHWHLRIAPLIPQARGPPDLSV